MLSILRKPYVSIFFFQAEDGIRDCLLSRGLGDVYKRQRFTSPIKRPGISLFLMMMRSASVTL